MMHEAMELAEDVQTGVKNVKSEDQKMKFEHLLEKKCKELEQLGDSLVFKEKEVLIQYKEKLEFAKLDRNPAMLEKRALLEETDSEEDEDEAYARGKSQATFLLLITESAFLSLHTTTKKLTRFIRFYQTQKSAEPRTEDVTNQAKAHPTNLIDTIKKSQRITF